MNYYCKESVALRVRPFAYRNETRSLISSFYLQRMDDDIVIISVEMPNGINKEKFKVKRDELTTASEVIELVKHRVPFPKDSLLYYDKDCDEYMTFSERSLEDAGFKDSAIVKMKLTSIDNKQNDQNAMSTGACSNPMPAPAAVKRPVVLRTSGFPVDYTLPRFSSLLTAQLVQNNAKHALTDMGTELQKKFLHELLEVLTEDIFKFTYNPSAEDIMKVCTKLVTEHPSLSNPIDKTGSWPNRITNKCSGKRNELRKMGVAELQLQTPGPNDDGSSSKRRRVIHRGAVNTLPDLNPNETEDTMNETIELLKKEFPKANADMVFVREKMMLTFPYRRHYLKKHDPKAYDMKDKYPYLFTEEQVMLGYPAICPCH